MKYRQLGKTGWNDSVIGYGGVVSSQHFDRAVIPGDGQKMSDEYVGWAVEHGINYFDVAPGYGDAQLLMGNSLKPYRKDSRSLLSENQSVDRQTFNIIADFARLSTQKEKKKRSGCKKQLKSSFPCKSAKT